MGDYHLSLVQIQSKEKKEERNKWIWFGFDILKGKKEIEKIKMEWSKPEWEGRVTHYLVTTFFRR